MAQVPLNYGQAPEDGTGDPLRTMFAKIQANLTDLDGRLASTTALVGALGGAAALNVGTTAGTVADGGALTAETNRAQAAEGANALAIQANAAAIAAETSRAQGVEALKAPLASPAFTGTPTVPTAALGTATTQAASTSFVAAAVAAGASGNQGVPPSRQVATAGLATGGGDLTADRTIAVPKAAQSDVAAGTDDAKALTSYSVAAVLGAKAPLASPNFVGTPLAPTASAGTNTQQIATTGFTTAALAALVANTLGGDATFAATVAAALGNRLRGDADGGYGDAARAQFLANLGLGPLTYGQCRLVCTSATQLTLQPFGGNLIWINGAYRKIPAAGIAFPNTGLAASTTHYLYAYWTGTAVALEASTTGRATDATYGHQIKSGDATRTLVGAFVTDASTPGQFADTSTRRTTASWFNRRDKPLYIAPVNNSQTTSTTAVQLNAAIPAFTWGDAESEIKVAGNASNSQGGVGTAAYVMVDGNTAGAGTFAQGPGPNQYVTHAPCWADTLTEGLHAFSISGYVSGYTGYFYLAAVGKVTS